MSQGADIDIRVVRDGRGPECNVWSNFKQVYSFICMEQAERISNHIEYGLHFLFWLCQEHN